MKPVSNDIHFPTLEKKILEFWKEHSIISKNLEANKGKERFVFYDGPPFATGLPHYGHILAGTIKDIVPRYWVMKGKYVERRWGWDCHGLPVEFEMEKELGLAGASDIEKMGVGKFNEACRNIVLRYTKEWETIVNRTGRWADFSRQYRTMDTPFMETVWWAVKQLWDKNLVFEGYRVMPYSWRISTTLSNFEANLNYKEVQDPAITVKFKSDDSDYYFLAWTTTPWTLPSNMGLNVHPDFDYVEVLDNETQEKYVLSKERLAGYYKTSDKYKVLKEFKGTALAGKTYEPLFPYFKDKKAKGGFKVCLAEYVTVTDGTGIVHCAPAHGEDDFEVGKKNGLPIVDATDFEGNFTSDATEYVGQNIKEAEKNIIKDLKAKGSIFRHETLLHSYPFCWRTETPLMNKAISTWFVKLDPIKDQLIKNNQETHWVPEHIKDGRFGKWLEAARDWNISRNRYWGTPIPIWRCQNKKCDSMLCIGSIEELEKYAGRKMPDIHKHFVDSIEMPCEKCNTTMKRIPEVLDCWFESGSMPYAQQHYPFEHKEEFEKNFPAHFIAEGLDQTRGWFYTLSVLSTALFNKPPFKNVIVNGLVLAEDGKKMSKRLKNYPDPVFILENYGADALRAYLITSPASHGEDLKFSEAGVKEIIRAVLLPYWNAYSFFVTYALADEWKTKSFNLKNLESLEDDLDQWIVSRLHSLIKNYDAKMSQYHLADVIPEVLKFVDELTNWYIRLNRRRYWAEEKTKSKEDAYQTLYYVLTEFSKILAPILPFMTEEIFQNLKSTQEESVHLASFPALNATWINTSLEQEMDLISRVVVMGRNLRNAHGIKTRQPLPEYKIIIKDASKKKVIEKYQALIAAELNVKRVSFSEKEADYVDLSAKANSKILGPKMGGKMKAAMVKIKSLTHEDVSEFEKAKKIQIEGVWLDFNDLSIERIPKKDSTHLIQSEGGVTVWLDSQVSEDLLLEGLAREWVNRIQKARKDLDLKVTDSIAVEYKGGARLIQAMKKHEAYVSSETLARRLSEVSTLTQPIKDEVDGESLEFQIKKV